MPPRNYGAGRHPVHSEGAWGAGSKRPSRRNTGANQNMWSNNNRAVLNMSRAAIIFSFAIVAVLPGFAAADEHSAKALALHARESRNFSFYFLSLTDNPSLDRGEFIRRSTLRIYRACGADCEMSLSKVIDHLRVAQPVTCSPGHMNVVMQVGTETVTYSHSGRQIELAGKCFYNDQGIRDVVENIDFIFH